MEKVAVGKKDRPLGEIKIISAKVFEDPFEKLRLAELQAIADAAKAKREAEVKAAVIAQDEKERPAARTSFLLAPPGLTRLYISPYSVIHPIG